MMEQALERISSFFVGVDLGQKVDPTALCVVERAEVLYDRRDPVTWECRRETLLELRYLERMKLRTPYPLVVERIREVAMDPALGERRTLVVDATGVGAPVVDLLRTANIDCEIMAVGITGGHAGGGDLGAAQHGSDRRVPKRDLLVGLQVLFDTGQLRIARGLPETEILVKELMGLRVKMSKTGHDSYGSGGETGHDDLVLAVSLACWRAKHQAKWNWFGGRPALRR